MLFSLSYLKKLANLPSNISDQVIIQAINDLGFEVESVSEMPLIKGIKFGKVLETYQNPDGDKLTVCDLQFSDKRRKIQTTATNVKVNDIVIAFVPGSSRDNVVFQSKSLKGIISEGMLSSVDELGLDSSLLFPEQIGINVYSNIEDLSCNPVELLGLNDKILDITILPNRVDASSYYVLSHELSAYFQTKPKTFKIKKGQFKSDINIKTDKVDNNVLFSCLETGFVAEISWIEKTLIAKSGLKVYHNAIDLASLTFLMTGQPVDAFDKTLTGNTFTFVNKKNIDKDQELIIDHQRFEINNNLVVTNANKIVNLPLVGTLDAFKPTIKSQQIVFAFTQLPHHQARHNTKKIKTFNYHTTQMMRLYNVNLMHLAIWFLTTKLSNFSHPVNLKTLVKHQPIKFLPSMIDHTAGFNLSNNQRFKEVLKSLKILGFNLTKNALTPPFYRADLTSFQDLCEEIFRFYNYNNFPLTQPALLTNQVNFSDALATNLVSQGFNETLTYLLTSPEKNIFNPWGFKQTNKLIYSVSNLRSEVRHSLMISLQDVAEHHLKQKFANVNLFEVGQIGVEPNVLAMASSTRNFNEMKQVLINLFGNNLSFSVTKNKFFHPNMSAEIFFNNNLLGFIGRLHPQYFNHNWIFCEIKLGVLLQTHFTLKSWEEKPLKSRDLTFKLPLKTSLEKEVNKLRKIPGIIDLFIIDKFEENDQEQTNIKVTLRILGSDEAIEKIDNKFN